MQIIARMGADTDGFVRRKLVLLRENDARWIRNAMHLDTLCVNAMVLI